MKARLVLTLTLGLLIMALALPAAAQAHEPTVNFPSGVITIEATDAWGGGVGFYYLHNTFAYDYSHGSRSAVYRTLPGGVRTLEWASWWTVAYWSYGFKSYSSIFGCYLGDTLFELEAWDQNGYYVYRSFILRVVDSGPLITPPDAVTVEAADSLGAAVTFGSASAVDTLDGPIPADSLRYYTGYGTDGQAEVYSGEVFPIGTTTITIAATDSRGNTGTATFTVSVSDTSAPVLSVPGDVTVEATSRCGAPVSYSVSSNDTVDGVVTPWVVPASGSTFPIGETTVWVSAKDGAGNASTATFTVTVLGATGILDNLAGDIMDAPDDPTAAGGIDPATETSLLAKVNAATAAVNRGNSNDAKVAMNDLKALINQVQAQTAKSISPEAAEAIIAAANRLIAVLGGSITETAPPMTTGSFVGTDTDGTVWQVQVNAVGKPFDPENSPTPLGAGTVSFTSYRSLPDGTQAVKAAFTVTVDRYLSVDYFASYGTVDAGAVIGIGGPVVGSTGEGVPGVGEYYLFMGFDGTQGFTNADGTLGRYPDTWKFVPWGPDATWERNLQRTILSVLMSQGTEHYYPPTPPETRGIPLPLWPVIEGDLDIQHGWIYG